MKHKLEKYAIAAGAIALGANVSQAQIIHTDLNPNEVVDSGNTSFDINLFSANKYRVQLIDSRDEKFLGLDFLSNKANAYEYNNTLVPLSLGAQMETQILWDNKNYLTNIGWCNGSSSAFRSFPGTSNKYIGIKFDNVGDTHYGWIQIDVAADCSTIKISGYAYNDTPDGPIMAGQIPEPVGLGLLAIGAAGVLARRKKSA